MSSPLARTGEQKPVVDKGHGTGALGPSDSSDTGSDVLGGPGMKTELREERDFGFDQGTTSDVDVRNAPNAGPDIGDGNLDSDSDAGGTGERANATEDFESLDYDVRPDRIVSIDEVVSGAAPNEGASNLELENDNETDESDANSDTTNR
jgi:hypothetical protein